VEIDGRDSSVSGGPFMWREHASATTHRSDDTGWDASHDGYRTLEPSVTHRRQAELDPEQLTLAITDLIESSGSHAVRMAFHLGPEIDVELEADLARLSWTGPAGPATAELTLPADLSWTAHRGETEPILGWYSPSFGVKVAAWTLVGTGEAAPGGSRFITELDFSRSAHPDELSASEPYQAGHRPVLSDVPEHHVSVRSGGRTGAGQPAR
jgi:hypothetical protein